MTGRRIGGRLDYSRLHFWTLEPEQQAAAIRRLIASGMSEYGASHATGLSVEMVRRILGEHARAAQRAITEPGTAERPHG